MANTGVKLARFAPACSSELKEQLEQCVLTATDVQHLRRDDDDDEDDDGVQQGEPLDVHSDSTSSSSCAPVGQLDKRLFTQQGYEADTEFTADDLDQGQLATPVDPPSIVASCQVLIWVDFSRIKSQFANNFYLKIFWS